MCDCFHLAFPNWHAASSGTGPGRRLRAPEPGTEDDSICDEPSQFTEGERPRPQGSSPVEEFPETEKYTDSDKECEADNDPNHKRGKKNKKSGFGSVFDKRSTPKMSKLKEVHSPESGVIVKTAKDGCAEGLIYGGGGKEGIFIKEVVPESPASKSLKLKEGDQVLSATVYFDNVSYEDAIQILEHAQAYKVKLCLKRKADATDNETAIDSDVIPEEEELDTTEMREQGKTKRRGDARISWPKFPSFGKGRKSRFTRSHSSSEADEQRKLELSPTTSDTESPIKSQDALKGKKKHKIKLSVLTKRSRISSSEDQDTETPAQTQETSDMLSPECLEGPFEETREVYTTDDLAAVEDLDTRPTEPAQHKAELISIDSTLKTEDVTVALAGQESPVKSPDGKKKKKERSELKMKILGKDKSHKKEAKAKASPKRLKTLGASVEMADQAKPDQGDQPTLDTQIISTEKVELDVPIVASTQKSPQKGKDKKKGKESKQKQEKSSPFKLPKVTLGDVATDETISKVTIGVKESTTTIKDADVKEDPYEKLSNITISKTDLPKREDIEIPGMEDASMMVKTTRMKERKGIFSEANAESPSETVQLSIDVDSVKEAVSKLPGYKLPKVDTSGVPIPEEITLIDANAQRISVKTPTKVVDTKQKHEAHFSSFNVTTSQEISKTSFKVPKIQTADLSAEEFIVAKVELKKSEDGHKVEQKEITIDLNKREDIIIPGKEKAEGEPKVEEIEKHEKLQGENEFTAATHSKESEKKSKKAKMLCFGKPDISDSENGTDLVRGEKIKGEKTKKDKRRTGAVMVDIKLPEFETPAVTSEAGAPSDDIEYIDSVESPQVKRDGSIKLSGFGVNLDSQTPKMDLSFPEISADGRDLDVTLPVTTAKLKLPEPQHADVTLGSIDVSIPEQKVKVEKPEFGDKHLQAGELDGHGAKFKIPRFGIKIPKMKGPEFDVSLPKKDVDVKLPLSEADVKSKDGPAMDITIGSTDVSLPELSAEYNKPQLDIKTLQAESEPDQKSKFKMPKLGITIPKVKGPEIDLSLTKQDVDGALPQPQSKIKIPEGPSATVDIKSPEKKLSKSNEGSPSKFKMPTFKLPKLGVGAPNLSIEVPDVDKEVKTKSADINIPDEVLTVDITTPSMGVEGPSINMKTTVAEQEGKGSKFKMPSLGFTLPKVKGPKIDLSLSTKDAEVTFPEAQADVKIPDAPKTDVILTQKGILIPEQKLDTSEVQVEVKVPETPKIDMDIKPPEVDAETEEHGGKFKIPRFGIKMPKIKGPEIDLSLSKKDGHVKFPDMKADVKLPEVPETDVHIGKADVSIPEVKMEIKTSDLPKQSLQTEGELDGQGDKFKMPKFGIKMPKIKGPEIDLSLPKREGHVKLPDAKADVKLPEVPEIDVNLGKADVSIPEVKMEIEKPELQIRNLQTEGELGGQGDKFKMPKFGIKMPKIKGPEIDLSLPKREGHVKLPDTKADVKLPEVPEIDVHLGKADVSIPKVEMEIEKPELQIQNLQTEGELGGQGDKFKMPKFGIKMPKIKGPEIDLSLTKRDGHAKLPDTKADVKLPEGPKIDINLGKGEVSVPQAKIEIEKPELQIQNLQTEGELGGQGDKFKMPKFGIKMPKIKGPEFDLSLTKRDGHVKLPDTKADVKLPEGPEIDINLGKAEVSTPEVKVEIKSPELQMQTEGELGGHDDKFKMPKFGIKMPKIKGPEFDFNLSKKDGEIRMPDTKADITLPEGPEIDANLGKLDVSIPKMKMEMEKPEVQMQGLQTEGELGGHGDKFKMPKFGIKTPKFKGPEIDFSLSKKDADVAPPKVEVKVPEVTKTGISLGEAGIALAKMEAEGPELEIKPLQGQVESEGHGGKFKMPKFGVSMPKVKGPEFHLGFSKKDVDVSLPETTADVNIPDVGAKEPSAKVEIKAPEIETTSKSRDGSPLKFKTPHLPSFSFSMPKIKGPEIDLSMSRKDKDMTLPEAKVEAKLPETSIDVSLEKGAITVPEMEVENPDLNLKSLQGDVEVEEKRSKFKMPKFGITLPKITGPDLSLAKKDGEVTVPEADIDIPEKDLKDSSVGVEIKAPGIKVETKEKEGSPSKFKMPTFKLPKFGVGTPSATVQGPEIDKDVKIDGSDIKVPEEVLAVSITAPSIDADRPSIHMTTTEIEPSGKGIKFKMPHLGFSVPQVKGPEITLPKTGEHETPKAIGEVQLPGYDHSSGVEIKGPEIDVQTSNVEGSPSKFKMPTFKLPKLGGTTPQVSVEVPDTDKNIEVDGAEIKLPEAKVDDSKFKKPKFSLPRFSFSKPSAKEPDVDVNVPVVDVSTTVGSVEVKQPDVDMGAKVDVELDGQESKFKMPKFGISMPKVKGPDINLRLSKKDADATIPDAEVQFSGVEIKQPTAEIEIKAPKIEVEIPEVDTDIQMDREKLDIPTGDIEASSIDIEGKSLELKGKITGSEGSGSIFKRPDFSISMPKVKGPDIDFSFKKREGDVSIPTDGVSVDMATPSIDIEGPSIDVTMAGTDREGKERKFKVPKFGISLPKVQGPEIDLSLSKTDVDVTVPEAKAELPEVTKIDDSLGKVDISVPDLELKVEKPEILLEGELDEKTGKFKLPKFGVSVPKIKGPEIDFSSSKKDVDVSLPDVKAEFSVPDAELKEPSAKVEIKAPESDVQVTPLKESALKFKLPRFSFSKLGTPTPNVSAEAPDMDKDIKIDGTDAEISVPKKDLAISQVKAEVKLPEVEIKEPSADVVVEQPSIEVDAKLKKPRFSLPRFSFSKPSVKAPEVDASVQDVSVAVPGEGLEVKGGELECEAEIESQGSKFKMPKFGITMPKVKGPEIDLSFTKKDVDVSLPDPSLEVHLPNVELAESSATMEINAPEMEAQLSNVKGSLTESKLPSIHLPTFGVAISGISAEAPEMDKDIKIDGTVAEISVPKQDVGVPQVKAEVKLPEVEIKEPAADVVIEQPSIEVDAKLKKPRFSLPRFSFSKPSPKTPDIDASVQDVNVAVPGEGLEVKGGGLDSETDIDSQGSKFKMPKFGITMPKIKGPEIDLSLTKKDVDVSLPEARVEVQLPNVELAESSANVEIKAPEVEAQLSNIEGPSLESKLPTFNLPTFGAATSNISAEVPNIDKNIKIDGADIHISVPEKDSGIAQVKADVQLPEVEIKEPSADVVIEQPSIELEAKLKKPRFSLPRFSFSKPSVKAPEVDASLGDLNATGPEIDLNLSKKDGDVEVPNVEKDLKIDGAEIKVDEEVLSVGITAPKIDADPPSIDMTTPQVTAEVPDTKKDIKVDEADIKLPEAKVDDAKFKKPRFSLPRFSFSKASTKEPEAEASVGDTDVSVPVGNLEVEQTETEPKEADGERDISVTLPEADAKVKEEEGGLDPEAPDADSTNVKSGSKFKLPGLSVSVSTVKGPEIDASASEKDADVLLPEAKGEVQVPKAEVKEDDTDVPEPDVPVVVAKRPSWTFPKFSFSRKSSEADVSPEVPKVEVTLPEVEAEVSLPDVEVKGPSVAIATDEPPITEPDVTVKKKFSLPRFSFSKASVKGPEEPDVDATTPEVKTEDKVLEVEAKASLTIDASETEVAGGSPKKVDTEEAKLKGDVTVDIKGQSVDIKTDESKAGTLDSEATKTEPDMGSPSKFKLPLFKFFSKPKTEEEETTPDIESKDEQQETEEETKVDGKSPKMSLTSFGDILKNIDVEFDVPKTDKEEEQLETANEAQEKLSEAKEQDTNAKQEATKSPEKTGWFKFPRFGLSSPSEPPKKKDEPKDEKSPEGEISPTSSAQSSEAFADISSAMTSENVGLSSSSPTKVTVKYSDPHALPGLEDIHSNVIISTTRSELISVEPNLPEKVTILSSGPSSSSEDTLRLESGKIHVITSNIQANPDSQLAKLLTAVQVQPAGGISLTSEGNETASWTVETSHSSKTTVLEKRTVVRQISGESKETVITKQITHVFDSTEPISDETATSIQRLRDSVHSEKMRFFDGTEE